MERREFLSLTAGFVGSAAFPYILNNTAEALIYTRDTRAKFIENNRIYITSAFWDDSSIDVANDYKKMYDVVCIPGVSPRLDGSLETGSGIEKAKVEGKPNLYIIQNHPEGQTWDIKRAAAFMRLRDTELREELAIFNEGIILDLESLTEGMNRSYHAFVKRVRNAYDAPLIVSLHAKARHNNQVYGLGKEMDYKAICDIADAVNYMTLDEWPENPEVPIADLDYFKRTLDTLFEQQGIERCKLIASIATYIKISYLKEDGTYDTARIPEHGSAKDMLSRLTNLVMEDEVEGQFIADYKKDDYSKEKVRGWMMTEAAFKARMELLRTYDINKVFFWYGGAFLTSTPSLRRIVYAS